MVFVHQVQRIAGSLFGVEAPRGVCHRAPTVSRPYLGLHGNAAGVLQLNVRRDC